VLDGDPEWEQPLPGLSELGRGTQRLLRQCLEYLPDQGVQAFRLGDLVNPLKVRVRAAHDRRNLPPDPEVVPTVRGDDGVWEKCLTTGRRGV
jgi:hypothetical protein